MWSGKLERGNVCKVASFFLCKDSRNSLGMNIKLTLVSCGGNGILNLGGGSGAYK